MDTAAAKKVKTAVRFLSSRVYAEQRELLLFLMESNLQLVREAIDGPSQRGMAEV